MGHPTFPWLALGFGCGDQAVKHRSARIADQRQQHGRDDVVPAGACHAAAAKDNVSHRPRSNRLRQRSFDQRNESRFGCLNVFPGCAKFRAMRKAHDLESVYHDIRRCDERAARQDQYRMIMQFRQLCFLSIFIIGPSLGLVAQVRGEKIGDGGLATVASVFGPGGLATDHDGNLYILESLGRRVRKVDAKTGVITTVAGNGKGCCFAEGKPATAVALHFPQAIALDAEGNIFISDSLARVYRVDSKTGLIAAVVGKTWDPRDTAPSDLPQLSATFEKILRLAVNNADLKSPVYLLSDYKKIYALLGNSLATFLGQGQQSYVQRVSRLDSPSAIAVDTSGTLIVSDNGTCQILRVDMSSKLVSSLAGTGVCGIGAATGLADAVALSHFFAVAVDAQGNVYFSSGPPNCVGRIDAQTHLLTSIPGTCDTKGGKTWAPSSLAVDRLGNLYLSQWRSNLVRRVDGKTGIVTTVAGNGLPDLVVKPVD